MTTSGYTGATHQGSGGTKEQAQQAAGVGADEGRHLAGVAGDEAKNVAGEARAQVQSLMQQAGQQVDEQSRQQKDRLAQTLRTFSDDLDGMAAQGNGGMAVQLAQEVASRARTLSSRLEQGEPRDLVEDVRTFARRKPGTFLLGALAAGVVAGRLTRGVKDAPSSGGVPGTAGAAGAGDVTDTGYRTPDMTRPTPGAPIATGTGVATGSSPAPDPLPGDPTQGTPAGPPTISTDTDPSETWTDPSEPGGRG